MTTVKDFQKDFPCTPFGSFEYKNFYCVFQCSKLNKMNMVGREGKTNLCTMDRQNTRLLTATLGIPESCFLYLVHVFYFFSSPKSIEILFGESTKISFSFATYWNYKRDKLPILETSPEFVSFSIPGIISESLCNVSHSDPNPANACLQRSSHTQSFEGRCRKKQGLSFSGCHFPVCTTMEFFPPFAGRFATCAPSCA